MFPQLWKTKSVRFWTFTYPESGTHAAEGEAPPLALAVVELAAADVRVVYIAAVELEIVDTFVLLIVDLALDFEAEEIGVVVGADAFVVVDGTNEGFGSGEEGGGAWTLQAEAKESKVNNDNM